MLRRYMSLVLLAIVVLVVGWFGLRENASEAIQTAAMKGDTAAVTAILQRRPSLAKTLGYRNYTPLHWAALDGNMKLAEVLLADGADPNVAAGKKNVTPLHLAVDGGHVKMVELLLSHKADPDARDSDGDSVLSWAAELNRPKEAALMIASGANVRSTSKTGRTPLHWAANHGNGRIVEMLLAHGADIEARDRTGITPLGCADFHFRSSAPKALIKHGANVHVPAVEEGKSTTPLHLAANWGNVEIARLLIDRKLKVNAKDAEGSTPLGDALWDTDCVKESGGDPLAMTALLLGRGANPNEEDRGGAAMQSMATEDGPDFLRLLNRHVKMRDKTLSAVYRHDLPGIRSMLKARPSLVHAKYYGEEKTLLYVAASVGDLEMVKLLVQAGSKVDEASGDGETPLCGAVLSRRTVVAAYLMDHGADPNVRGSWSFVAGGPLSRAADIGDTGMMRALIEHGARADGQNQGDPAPIIAAADFGGARAVSFLLEAGANPNSADQDGKTALICAAQDDEQGPAKIRALVRHGADVNAADYSGATALRMAIEKGFPKNAEALIECGADVNARGGEGGHVWSRIWAILTHRQSGSPPAPSPLGLAQNSRIVRTLLLHGARE